MANEGAEVGPDDFERKLAAANVANRSNPRIVDNGDVTYHNFDDASGKEIGWISYRSGEVMGYTIR